MRILPMRPWGSAPPVTDYCTALWSKIKSRKALWSIFFEALMSISCWCNSAELFCPFFYSLNARIGAFSSSLSHRGAVGICLLCFSLSLDSSSSCAVLVHFTFLFVLRTTHILWNTQPVLRSYLLFREVSLTVVQGGWDLVKNGIPRSLIHRSGSSKPANTMAKFNLEKVKCNPSKLSYWITMLNGKQIKNTQVCRKCLNLTTLIDSTPWDAFYLPILCDGWSPYSFWMTRFLRLLSSFSHSWLPFTLLVFPAQILFKMLLLSSLGISSPLRCSALFASATTR